MFYITEKQYITLCKTFSIKEIKQIGENSSYFHYYMKYGFDSLCELIEGEIVVGFIMIFECQNSSLYSLEVKNTRINMYLLDLLNRDSFIMSKQELLATFSDVNDGSNVINDNISEILNNCNSAINKRINIKCAGGAYFEIESELEIPKLLIDEYLIVDEKSEVINRFSIVECNDREIFSQVRAQFNTIQYLYQQRTVNKAKIVSEGNGHVFFSTSDNNFVIGYQKYYNYADSPLTFYVFDNRDEKIYIFAIEKTNHQVLRAAQALVAYSNILSGGYNLHASAVVVNDKAVILLGEKGAGKTTNMIFGIQSNPEMKIMSNDLVHLFCKQGDVFAIGSCRKVTIRPATVSFFTELQGCIGDEYSSIGNPSSNHIQIVTTITQLAKAFHTTTQPLAPVRLLVVLEYSCEQISVSIDWDYQVDWPVFIKKHLQHYYDGKQTFWNDIYPYQKSGNHQLIKNVKVVRAVVSEKNIKKTWEELLNY